MVHGQFHFKFISRSNVKKQIGTTLWSHGHYLVEGPQKTIITAMTHPSHANFLLSCEEGLPPICFCLEEGVLDFAKSTDSVIDLFLDIKLIEKYLQSCLNN